MHVHLPSLDLYMQQIRLGMKNYSILKINFETYFPALPRQWIAILGSIYQQSESERNNIWLYSRGQQSFLVKGQIINILGFARLTVSVTTIHLCCCSTNVTIDNSKTNECVPINLYIQKRVGWIWCMGPQSVNTCSTVTTFRLKENQILLQLPLILRNYINYLTEKSEYTNTWHWLLFKTSH